MISGVDTTITKKDEDSYETYIYNSDSTFSYSGMDNGFEYSGNGTYTINNEIITETENNITKEWDYEICDNILTVSYTTESYLTIYTYQRITNPLWFASKPS